MSSTPTFIIGQSEKIDFPRLELFDVDAKIDTGAVASVLSCREIKMVLENGEKKIRFTPSIGSQERSFTRTFHKKKKIRNSFGNEEVRYSVFLDVVVFGLTYSTEFSLRDRSSMDYPVLLGQKFLKNHFLVDVSKKFISYQIKKKTII
jgi:hypothetical protein